MVVGRFKNTSGMDFKLGSVWRNRTVSALAEFRLRLIDGIEPSSPGIGRTFGRLLPSQMNRKAPIPTSDGYEDVVLRMTTRHHLELRPKEVMAP